VILPIAYRAKTRTRAGRLANGRATLFSALRDVTVRPDDAGANADADPAIAAAMKTAYFIMVRKK
jgi:hypothetical protein